MPLVSLRHLHAFCAVAASGGIRKSSDRLYKASSAIARSVAALEEGLAVALFERKGSGMLLTAAGDVVRLRADRIHALLRSVCDDAMRHHGRCGPAGQRMAGGIDVMLNENRLQAAILLSELHHMPSVAQAMGTSQAAVSQAIGRLQDMVGQPLFQRSARGMLPSEVGLRWIARFELVLTELRHIPDDVAALAGVVQGIVTIGALPLARTQLLPQAITAVLAKHPRLQVRSLESTYGELTAGLLSGRIDFIVGALRAKPGEAFSARALVEDKAVVVARAGHPLAQTDNLTLAGLMRYSWVLSRAGTPLRDSIDKFFEGHGTAAPEAAVETGDLALLRGLLVASDMLTVLSAHQLDFEISTGQLVVLPFEMPGLERWIGVTTRRDAHLSPGALALIEELETVSKPAGAASNQRGGAIESGKVACTRQVRPQIL